ncbi:hypothetical protein [Absidia glauca]|uniref:Uncharacterized protein n=1 Tax=Absidia glauca TaxID=4829 RepID=A0A168SP05_ABSGL|nr:hypothetical protein [Absidia glauca]
MTTWDRSLGIIENSSLISAFLATDSWKHFNTGQQMFTSPIETFATVCYFRSSIAPIPYHDPPMLARPVANSAHLPLYSLSFLFPPPNLMAPRLADWRYPETMSMRRYHHQKSTSLTVSASTLTSQYNVTSRTLYHYLPHYFPRRSRSHSTIAKWKLRWPYC